MQQVFFRNLISGMITGFLLWKNRIPFFGPKNYQVPLLLRSFFGFLGVIMMFYGTAYARQADVATLNRTSPVWVTLFAVLILKERISRIQIPVIVLCLAGAFITMQPSFDSNPLPLLMALGSAITAGLAYTMITFCKGAVNPLTVIFYFSFFSTVCAGFLMIPSFVMPTGSDFLMLLGIGVFAAGGQIGLTYAYQKAPASEVSIYNYTGIIFSNVLGYAILGEKFALSSVLGALLIITGGLLSYFYNYVKPKSM